MKEMGSALCAACLVLGVLPSALAVDITAPPSEHAGQAVVCQVFSEENGAIASRLVAVDIPDGATQAEEMALLFDAACDGAKSRNARGSVDIISTKRNFNITNSSTDVGGGTALQNYARIHAGFSSSNLSVSKISVLCRNTSTDKESNWMDLDLSPVAQAVIFTVSDVTINKGNSFSVYAKTYGGTAFIATCTIQGSAF